MNCPFFGRQMYRNNSLIVDPPFLLLDTKGSQCALVMTAHRSACIMFADGEIADWDKCPRVKEIRMETPE